MVPPSEVMKLLSLSLKEQRVPLKHLLFSGNVLLEYVQPNMRWLDDDKTIHKRVRTNLRKAKSL